MSDFLLSGVNAAAFLLCAAFLAYVASIIVPLLRHRRGPIGDPTRFNWHFFVPCLNEEQVIAATVSDLFKKFPTAHIWCIDDASTDSTHQIVARMASRSRRVHVVTRRLPDAQQGKGPALNAAWKALREYLPADADLDSMLVGVVDADGILDPYCPAVITGPELFGNPSVSAIQILVRVVNQATEGISARTRLLIRMQDIEFTCVIAGMQMLRRHVGSTAMGGNGQFTRASALQRVSNTYGTPWEKALLEDFELGLRILLTGGQTEYCHDTWVAQQGPPTVGRLMRQRSRWAQGLMQCFRYFLPVMRSRKISTAAALEIAVFLLLPWFQLLGIVVYLVSLVVLVFYAVTTVGGPLHWLGAGAWGLIPLFLLFGLGPLALWGPIYRRTAANDLSRGQAALLGLVNWPYSYIHHVSTWWAFGRMLRSRHDWKKTDREDVPRPATTRRPAAAPASTGPSLRPARPAQPVIPRPPRARPAVAGSMAARRDQHLVRPGRAAAGASGPNFGGPFSDDRTGATQIPAAATATAAPASALAAALRQGIGSPGSDDRTRENQIPAPAPATATAAPAAAAPALVSAPGVAAAPDLVTGPAGGVKVGSAAVGGARSAIDRELSLMAAGTLRVSHSPGRNAAARARRRAAAGGDVTNLDGGATPGDRKSRAAPVVGGRLRLAPPPPARSPVLAAAGRVADDVPD